MLKKSLIKTSASKLVTVSNVGLFNLWGISSRSESTWINWARNLINPSKAIETATTKLQNNIEQSTDRIVAESQSLKVEIRTSTAKLENVIQQSSDNVVKEAQKVVKQKVNIVGTQPQTLGNHISFVKALDDVTQGVIKVLTSLVVGGGIAYLIKDYVPEQVDSLLGKYIPGYNSREKIYIQPEAFDLSQMVARSGTKKLENFIDSKLSSGKKVIMALTGPAGSGKSEMALEYASIMWKRFEKIAPGQTRIVQIIHAEDLETLEEEFRIFAKKLGIDTNNKDIRLIQKEVNDRLDLYSNWILIFDNVNKYDVNIVNYIPTSSKGTVIVTKQSPDELFEHDIEIIDITSNDYKLLNEEVFELFKKRTELTLSSEDKIKISILAHKLLYSPLALKRAADLKALYGKNLDDIIKIISIKSQNQLSIYEIYQQNLLTLNKALINLLPGDTKALLAIIFHSNPDYIDSIIGIKEINLGEIGRSLNLPILLVRDIIEIMSELKLMNIIVGYRGDRIHRSMREAFIEVINKKEIDILKALAPIYSSLRMSNYYSNDVTNNAPIIPHILTFFDLVEAQGGKDINLHLDAICALRNMGTQFVNSNSRIAEKYLQKAKESFERFVGIDVNEVDLSNGINFYNSKLKDCEIRLGSLGRDGGIDRNLIDLYAGILYQLGRIYFHTKDSELKINSKIYLDCAEDLANISRKTGLVIGKQNSNYDEHKGFVFKQNGILFMQLDKAAKSKEEVIANTIEVINGYNELLKDPELQKDIRSIATCYTQLVRAYLQLYEFERKLEDLNEANKFLDLLFKFKNGARDSELLILKGKIYLYEADFSSANKEFNKVIHLLELDRKFNSPFLAEAYLGKVKAEVGSLNPIDLSLALKNPMVIYNIAPYIDASIKIQNTLGRLSQHPEMKEVQDWKNLIDNLKIAERYELIEAEHSIQVMCITEIKYDNPMLNSRLLDFTSGKDKAFAVNKPIEFGLNNQEDHDHLKGIELESLKDGPNSVAYHVKYDQEQLPKKTLYTINQATLTFFIMKEVIETIPTIEYFFTEILHINVDLPEFIESNYFKIALHYTVCNLGMLAIARDIELIGPVLATATYGGKILTYEYLSKLKQESLQNTEEQSINSPTEFVEKCGFDISAQTLLGIASGLLSGTPVFYNIIISATVGGMQCYNVYNHNKGDKDYALSTVQVIIPYIADAAVLYATSSNMHFDFSTKIGQMIAVKNSLAVVSSVVATDYITKLALLTTQETIDDIRVLYLDPAINYIDNSINDAFSSIGNYFFE